MQDKIYTIDDIARELGVSKTTVSRAISGKGRVSQATRDRVFSFIKQYNYHPNVQARGLAKSKTYNLGLMLPSDYSVMDFTFFKECINGIYEAAAMHGYDIVIAIMDGKDLPKGHRLITDRKVDGIILTRSTVSGPKVQSFLQEMQMPFVVVGPSESPDAVWVDNKNCEGSCELVKLLLGQGLCRLALLGGNRDYLVTESRLQGYLEAHRALHIEADESLIFFDMDRYAAVSGAVEKLLEKKPDGIVCMDDFIVGMLLGCLREKRVRVPEDIKVACLYDNPWLELYGPTITGLRFDTRALGRNACLMLLKLLGENIQEEPVPLNYELIIRKAE